MFGLSPPSYTKSHTFVAGLRDMTIQVISKPGLPHWNEITPTTALLSEHIQLRSIDKVLLLGCRHGALGVVLARLAGAGELWLMDTSFIALECSRQTLEKNGISPVHLHPVITLLPDQAEQFDCVAMENPKGRKLARRWLIEAFELLKPNGRLYLAGANDEGIQAVIKDAQDLFGKSVILGYKKGHRVSRLIKPALPTPRPEWTKDPGIAPGTWQEFDCRVSDQLFHLCSLPGVFSLDRLDEGSALLLENLEIHSGARLLDVGCGYGILGLAAAFEARLERVDFVDANLLAIASSQFNLRSYPIPQARVLPSDLLSAVTGETYTHILSNPPFHTGKAVDYSVASALIGQARQALEPGGCLTLVANQFIHYERLMAEYFPDVHILARTRRYHVLSARKR